MIIVAIMKKEHQFLQEWLDYHISIGVNKYLLFNNDVIGYDLSIPNSVEIEWVDYSMYEGRITQLRAYTEACGKYPGETMVFIDIDEFITINPDFKSQLCSDKPLLDAAFEWFGVDGLALSWLNIGASGLLERPEDVLNGYDIPCPKVKNNYNFKSIYRTNQQIIWNHNPHRAGIGPVLYDTDKKVVKSVITNDLYDKIYIRHYITKSWQDYVEKLKRGNFTRGLRDTDTFFKYNPDMMYLKKELTAVLNFSEFPTIKRERMPYRDRVILISEIYICHTMNEAVNKVIQYMDEQHDKYESEEIVRKILATYGAKFPNWKETLVNLVLEIA